MQNEIKEQLIKISNMNEVSDYMFRIFEEVDFSVMKNYRVQEDWLSVL